jgi:hypothetical protein
VAFENAFLDDPIAQILDPFQPNWLRAAETDDVKYR